MTYKNDDHLEYIRSLPSIVSFKTVDIVSHHVRTSWNSGGSQKPADIFTLPMTDDEHKALHNMGESRYWDKEGINPFEEIMKILYLKGCI